MPAPCSGKKFDINFGNRLYSKEKRPGSPLFEYNLLPNLRKTHTTKKVKKDRAVMD